MNTLSIFKSYFWLYPDTTGNKKGRSVFIHSSRFNHSCQPNVRMWKLPNDQPVIWRTTKKIKAGEELTYCYAPIPFGLKKREFRQKFIKEMLNMICICDFCKIEVEDKNDITSFEAFEKEELELKRLTDENKGLKGPSIEDLNDYEAICQNTMKQIQCYKNIYNLGKKNNVSWNYLYQHTLLKGIDVAMPTIFSALNKKQSIAFLKEHGFKLLEEVVKLFKTAETMDDALGVTDEERFMCSDRLGAHNMVIGMLNKSYLTFFEK